MASFDAAQVRDYYDRHSPAFVSLGQGGTSGAIHRAVWAPGVATRSDAFHYVDDEIAALAATLTAAGDSLHVVDLGCGVGGSLCHLARRLPLRGTGITLSPVQVRLAADQIAAAGLAERVRCVEGDYCDLPADVSSADLAYAIESFVHAPDPSRFFDECRQLVRPGGLLVICDDMRGHVTTAHARRTIAEFCGGWHVNALLAPDELQRLAAAAGFSHEWTRDLTPWLELRRWRDRLISVMLTTLGALGVSRRRFDDLVGGRALQKGLQRGWIRYQLAVFRRRD